MHSNSGDRPGEATRRPWTPDRRQFLKSAGVGAAALGAGALLGRPASAAGLLRTSAPPASAAADVSGTLSFVYLGTAEQQQSWNSLFEKFTQAYPDVELQPTGVPVDNWAAFFDKVSTQLAGGTKYDLIQVATEGMQLFAGRGLIHPLDELMARDAAEIDDFTSDESPKLAEWNTTYASPDGQTYYLPTGFNTMAMWVNTEVLAAAGVDVPADDWTWDDFHTMGVTIKEKTDAFLYPATAEYFIGVMPWLTTNGASTMDAEWAAATCDTPEAIEAAAFVRQLVVDGLSPPPGGSFDRFALTTQGKMAMFGAGRWPIIQMREAEFVDSIKIVPWPQKTQHGSPVGWGSFAIFESTNNLEAAWAFMKYNVSVEGMNATEELGSTVTPSRVSLANGSPYLDDSPEGTTTLFDALDYATPIPSPLKGNLVQRAIEDNWAQILAGETSPEDGMKQMAQDITANL